MNFANDEHFDHEWLSDVLSEVGLALNASHVHGSLVGYLCADGPMPTRQGLDDQLNAQFSELDDAPNSHWFVILLDEPELELSDEMQAELDDFARAAARQLGDEHLRLELLLPDDSQELMPRAQALGEWCSGFLGGLGLGGFNKVRLLSKQAREALSHLERIARTEVELDDDVEGNEDALMELSEFVKVAALTLYTEIRLLGMNPKKPTMAAPATLQ